MKLLEREKTASRGVCDDGTGLAKIKINTEVTCIDLTATMVICIADWNDSFCF